MDLHDHSPRTVPLFEFAELEVEVFELEPLKLFL